MDLKGRLVTKTDQPERSRQVRVDADLLASLRESERKYRALVEQLPDGLIVGDQQGNILDANQQLCSLLGYTRQELLGLSIPQVLIETDPGSLPARVAALRAGETLHG